MIRDVRVLHDALPPELFRRLDRAVLRVGRERLARTYQTTLWYAFGPPETVVDEVILRVRALLPPRVKVAGVEWWLSRMHTTDVRVDFHRDRDEQLALAGGPEVHPRVSSVLFLNRVRGGALAITPEPPCEDNPSLAPERLDTLTLVAPRPNRLALFPGTWTHGVLDADNQVPDGRLPGTSRLRRTLIMNWWSKRPTGVPTWGESRVYRALAR